MAAYQAPPSLEFSRQEHWSGLPFPSPMHESKKWSEVAQSCPTLCDSMDCRLPGSSVHGIFQARVLEWGAVAFPDPLFTTLENTRKIREEVQRQSWRNKGYQTNKLNQAIYQVTDCNFSAESKATPPPPPTKSLQSCPTLCNPIDSSSPGSTIPGLLQARTLEWVAISFSKAWKWKGRVKWLSRVWLFATPWTAAYQAPPSIGFSRQEYWSGVPLPSPESKARWFLLGVMPLFLGEGMTTTYNIKTTENLIRGNLLISQIPEKEEWNSIQSWRTVIRLGVWMVEWSGQTGKGAWNKKHRTEE